MPASNSGRRRVQPRVTVRKKGSALKQPAEFKQTSRKKQPVAKKASRVTKQVNARVQFERLVKRIIKGAGPGLDYLKDR